MLACEHGNGEILQLLLDAGADAKRARTDGVSALALCAGTTTATVLARLIEGGASVDGAGAGGQTPLMWAAARGRLDNLQLLLAKGANVNRVTANGFTPLFFALKSGSRNCRSRCWRRAEIPIMSAPKARPRYSWRSSRRTMPSRRGSSSVAWTSRLSIAMARRCCRPR